MVDRGDTDLVKLTSQLTADNERNAYVRALLQRRDGGWTLRHAAIFVGIEPPGWVDETWQYEQLALVARTVPAAKLPVLCLEAACGKATLGEFEFTVPATSGRAHWQRQPSFARLGRLPLPQPTTIFTIAPAVADTTNLAEGMLVGEACPSFPEPNSAWRAFSERDFTLRGAQTPPMDLAVVHIAETRGWIGRIRITATEMTVEVHGDAVAGCELELYGATDRTSHQLEDPGTVTFPLPTGLPEHAWLWLKRGTSWLDYRSVYPPSGWTGDLAQAGVEFEVPVDPQATLEALIAAGEGSHLEFKQELVTGRKLKTVAAFATGDGGTLVFGIDRDEVTVVGLDGDDPGKLRDRLGQLIHAAITPTPVFNVNAYTINGKSILVLDIPPGDMPPYGVVSNSDSREKPEFYVRRGASTYPAKPEDLRQAVLSRSTPVNGRGRLA